MKPSCLLSNSVRRSHHLLGTAALCALLSGCLIGKTSSTQVTGRPIGTETLAQVQPGKSKEYVSALLGEPSEKTTASDTTEIWKWYYSEKRDTNGGIIFIIGTHDTTQTKKTTYVEFKDGLVVKSWADTSSGS